MKRTWPIAPTPEVLRERWSRLLDLPSDQWEQAFRPTRDRSVDALHLAAKPAMPRIERYAYRSFDHQWVLFDARLGDFMRPSLWRSAGPRQVFMTSLLTNVLGPGPAAVATAHVPDLDHFRGSFGGKAVIPLWRDATAHEPNIAAHVLPRLAARHGRPVDAEALFAYCYALLSAPSYVARFAEELREPGPRVPLTASPELFERAAGLGRTLVWFHTFGERFGQRPVPHGRARCVAEPCGIATGYAFDAAKERLEVGDGAFEGISPDVWAFSVSGLRVLRSWLAYRIARPRRRAVSVLDTVLPRWDAAMAHELLELVWVLEATLAVQPELDALLDDVVRGPKLEF